MRRGRRGRRGRMMMMMMRRRRRRVMWRDLWSRLDIGLGEGKFVSWKRGIVLGMERSFLGMRGSFLGRGRFGLEFMIRTFRQKVLENILMEVDYGGEDDE
jgi:hypothetical protein